MKKFICGFLTGALIFATIGSYAAITYTATPATFKVMVNGKNFVSDPPALVVEGRTYLPLRAMGDALGVPVNWNEEKNQAEVGNSAPITQENNYSRKNPAPLNTVQTYVYKSDYLTDYSATIRVKEIIRGEDAWKKIKEANMFNSEADEGYEYILAKVAFSVLSVENDESVYINSLKFDTYSGNNEEMPYASVVEPEPELTGSHYAGANVEGWMTVMVKKDDKEPKLAYGLDYDGSGGIWFKLYE